MKQTTRKRLEKLNRLYTRLIVERLFDNLPDDLELELKRSRVRLILRSIWETEAVDTRGDLYLYWHN